VTRVREIVLAPVPPPRRTRLGRARGTGRGGTRLGLAAALIGGALLLAAPGTRRAAAEDRSDGCAAAAIEKGARLERTIEVGGVPRSYILDVPETVAAGDAVPLLLDFHGFGHSAAGVWRVSGFRELGVRSRFITAYPQGLDVRLLGRVAPGWEIFSLDENRDVAFARALLDQVEAHYCIDRDRVYSTGFSNGAFLSHLLGCVLADRIAAIAPVSGGDLDLPCTPARPVSVIIHHGRADELIDVGRGRALFERWKRVASCPGEKASGDACNRAVDCRDGVEVAYCEFDGGHRWPAQATSRIWTFLFDHPKRP
jgi:polyhydroxybutyrate depolymerase